MKALVFIGPSISAREVREILPEAEIRPPIARDDLYRAREEGYTHFLIVDGAYTQAQAISPREVVDVAKDGATIVGAASMGALRASECWPAGVHGEGLIYRAYRAGVLTRDDEVAVTTDPDREHCGISVPLVNIRYAVSQARRRGLCNRETANKLISVAEKTFYPDRVWSRLFKDTALPGDGALFDFCKNTSLKKLDAICGLKKLRQLMSARTGAKSETRFRRAHRYDENAQVLSLKRARPRIKLELLEWLFGSGRYQSYLWAWVAGHPQLKQARSPEALREQLPALLGSLLADPTAFADAVWEELELLDELDTELMRMYAAERLSEEAKRLSLPPSTELEQQTRELTAIAHGLSFWTELRAQCPHGQLWGAIPFSWIEAACQKTATARAAKT